MSKAQRQATLAGSGSQKSSRVSQKQWPIDFRSCVLKCVPFLSPTNEYKTQGTVCKP